MERIIGYNRIWVDNFDRSFLEEFIISGQPFYFSFREKDYLIEAFYETGYIIVDPFRYYKISGEPEKTDFAYPYHSEAKTAEQFMSLPFLDGKNIFERFDELRFFDISAIYDE